MTRPPILIMRGERKEPIKYSGSSEKGKVTGMGPMGKAAWRKWCFGHGRMGRVLMVPPRCGEFGVRQRVPSHMHLCDLWPLLGSFFICEVRHYSSPMTGLC